MIANIGYHSNSRSSTLLGNHARELERELTIARAWSDKGDELVKLYRRQRDEMAAAIQTQILDSPRLNELEKSLPYGRSAEILRHFRALLATSQNAEASQSAAGNSQ